MYSSQLAKGNDIASGFEKAIFWFLSLFEGSKKSKPTMRTVYKKTNTTTNSPVNKKISKTEKQQKIDSILDKIGKSGYDSLTKPEKDFLFNAGKDH